MNGEYTSYDRSDDRCTWPACEGHAPFGKASWPAGLFYDLEGWFDGIWQEIGLQIR